VRVAAPGKVVLTGAYAVLEGGTAVVVAVDRYAIADGETVDTRALHDERGAKLGLGSSAASVVARLGHARASKGADLGASMVRALLFADARREHAREQAGGSGVDVAASVHGGVLAYRLEGGRGPVVRPVLLPDGLVMAVFWCGKSARTSELRARVDALRSSSRATHEGCMAALVETSDAAARVLEAGDSAAYVEEARGFARALGELGRAADAPIVPPAFAEVAHDAGREGAVFFPSGAGGGDVGVYLGVAPPSPGLLDFAARRGMQPLALAPDRTGLRVLDRKIDV
jgi:phosphomevalonate kinase